MMKRLEGLQSSLSVQQVISNMSISKHRHWDCIWDHRSLVWDYIEIQCLSFIHPGLWWLAHDLLLHALLLLVPLLVLMYEPWLYPSSTQVTPDWLRLRSLDPHPGL